MKSLDYSTNEQSFIHLYAKPNSPILGKRLGKRFKDFKKTIESLDSNTIDAFQTTGTLNIDNESFTIDDILIFREAMEGTNAVSDRFISIDMDCTPNEELLQEGRARELVNRIQKTRKEDGLDVSDRIRLIVHAEGKLLNASNSHQNYIMKETLCIEWVSVQNEQAYIFNIDGETISFAIEKLE